MATRNEQSLGRTRADFTLSPGSQRPSAIRQVLLSFRAHLRNVPIEQLASRVQLVFDELRAKLIRYMGDIEDRIALLDEKSGLAARVGNYSGSEAPLPTKRWNHFAVFDTDQRTLRPVNMQVTDSAFTQVLLQGNGGGFIGLTIEDLASAGANAGLALQQGSRTWIMAASQSAAGFKIYETSNNSNVFVAEDGISQTYALYLDSAGNLGVGNSSSPSTNLHVYENTTDTTPTVTVEQDGTGDSALQFLLTAGESFVIGIDNSDSDKFKISDGSALGSGDRMDMSTTETVFNEGGSDLDFRVEASGDANALFVDGANGRIGLGIGVPTQKIHSYVSSGNNVIRVESDGTDSQCAVQLENDAQSWRVRVLGSVGDRFEVQDATGAVAPFFIEAGAPGSALSVASSGDVSVGAALAISGSSGPTLTAGSGSPEGVVTAPVGSLFLRTDGGASTTLYVKESGATDTGWVAK